ncbi:hypothetical protein DKT77_02260 [Meridianimarinicoccus roseus]|jgi:predicted ABC-type ATPase|uniref:Zeta toxin domain-containing protein n=1 Tax=Meridianimarinicoccus roseus TaxID=2072018 RepID=A0A2V2LPW1_9RHOB|nr:zeta toxin family protein [Meridianimarinicoccus roseus]PWR04259.1 hypothetical protein DKT77_02260 [Meridianimarinicoccus roseus]
MRPSLVLLAGPNGAGKSTLFKERVEPVFKGSFVNADIIQREELQDPSVEASYEAAQIAQARRDEMFETRSSFATETVFSHPSKLDIISKAKVLGYLVVVMHVGVENPDISVARVRRRTEEGGHDVPDDKIRTRYDRCRPLIRQAVLMADRGMVFDNSKLNDPPRPMLVFASGRLSFVEPHLPAWILQNYARDLKI